MSRAASDSEVSDDLGEVRDADRDAGGRRKWEAGAVGWRLVHVESRMDTVAEGRDH